ncbi:MAG TPA: palindromic element RPE4 domain-containing protein [Rickettsia endosymbiont of Ceroptres masudai]|nr:palindromic element RPE4 domain-containing protein [Rickettsia endosymbiont of Ceroptres masudai]
MIAGSSLLFYFFMDPVVKPRYDKQGM